MTTDPRRALTRLLNAFENHFDIARDGGEVDEDALVAAEEALRDAFFTYDDQLFTRYGVLRGGRPWGRPLLHALTGAPGQGADAHDCDRAAARTGARQRTPAVPTPPVGVPGSAAVYAPHSAATAASAACSGVPGTIRCTSKWVPRSSRLNVS